MDKRDRDHMTGPSSRVFAKWQKAKEKSVLFYRSLTYFAPWS